MIKNFLIIVNFTLLFCNIDTVYAGGGTTGTGLKSAEQLGDDSLEDSFQTNEISLVGSVYNSKGQILKNVEVIIESTSDVASCFTDSLGKFSLTLNPALNETLTITVKHQNQEASLEASQESLVAKRNLNLIFVQEGQLKIKNQ